QVLQGGRNSVVIFTADDEKPVDSTIKTRQLFQPSRSPDLGMLLVHPIQQRQLQLERIHKVNLVPAPLKLPGHEPGRSRPHTVATDGAQKHCDGERLHGLVAAGVSTMRPPLASCRMKPSRSSTGVRQGAFSSVRIVSL